METDILFKIKRIREIKNFGQKYMALELDVSTKTYSRLECGETDLSVIRLEQIAAIFEMTPVDLYNFNPKAIFKKIDLGSSVD